jgi:hypothetical protein
MSGLGRTVGLLAGAVRARSTVLRADTAVVHVRVDPDFDGRLLRER